MSVIDAGTKAPDFAWPALDGKMYSLSEALKSGPMLVAFFKVGCPTCQYTFPFLERAAKHLGRIWGVSQDNERATRDFAEHFGVTFPLLLEDTDDFPTSNEYGLTHVPSIFLIDRSGEIIANCVGFGRQDLLDMTAKLGVLSGRTGLQLFESGEDIPKFKAG
jgi:peroxiredoxin